MSGIRHNGIGGERLESFRESEVTDATIGPPAPPSLAACLGGPGASTHLDRGCRWSEFYREQDHTEGRLAAELLRRLLIAGSTFPPGGAGERGSLTSGQRRLPAKKFVLLSVFVVALC